MKLLMKMSRTAECKQMFMCPGESFYLPDWQRDDLCSKHQVDRLQQQRSAVCECVCLRVCGVCCVWCCVHLTFTICSFRLLHTHLHPGWCAGERHGVPARSQPTDGHQPRPWHHLDRSLHGHSGEINWPIGKLRRCLYLASWSKAVEHFYNIFFLRELFSAVTIITIVTITPVCCLPVFHLISYDRGAQPSSFT